MAGIVSVLILLSFHEFYRVSGAEDVVNGWGDSINWHSFEDGLKAAEEQKKPLMLVIHKSWCGACKALKPQFAESEEIKKHSQKFIMVNTVDDQEPKGEQYSPDGGYIPRILFLGSDGKVDADIINVGGNEKYKYYYSAPKQIVKSMERAHEKLSGETAQAVNEEL